MAGFRLSRRGFLRASLGGAAVGLAGVSGYWFTRKPVRLALIGAGIEGNNLARAINRSWWLGGLFGQLRAVCDVDRNQAEKLTSRYCPDTEIHGDYRKVLERDDIDAVVIATPDHWHTIIALESLSAGKAVYCEKPISLTVAEGQLLVKAVERTGGVFQGGTQQRTSYKFRTASELVRNGRLGKVHRVRVTLPKRWATESDGPFETCAPPEGLNWEMWLGQAPLVDYCPERCHGSFRRWYEYSGGQMSDWGAHHIDIVQWALGLDYTGPVTISGNARIPKVENGYNTPIDFTVDLKYANGVHVHVRTHADEEKNGIIFEGESGEIFVSRSVLRGAAVDELAKKPLPRDAVRLHPTAPSRSDQLMRHLIQFFACVRRGAKPLSDVASQHRSASTCHLANIAMRLARTIHWDPRLERVSNDPEANAMLSRPQRPPYALPQSV